MFIVGTLTKLTSKVAFASVLQILQPAWQAIHDWNTNLLVMNHSQKIIRVHEGLVVRKQRDLNPGEQVEWNLLGTKTIFHLHIEEKDGESFKAIPSCNKNFSMAKHTVEVIQLNAEKEQTLQCKFDS